MTQMQKLIVMLVEGCVPFEISYQTFDKVKLYPQIWIPNKNEVKADVICHPYSFGGKEGLLEIMADFDDFDDVVKGYLTAGEAYNQIIDIAFREGF